MNPVEIVSKLEAIERDLAARQPALESAARNWFITKRNRERNWAVEFMQATGTVADRKAVADRETASLGIHAESEYEAIRAVVRVLDSRASILQTLCRVGRA